MNSHKKYLPHVTCYCARRAIDRCLRTQVTFSGEPTLACQFTRTYADLIHAAKAAETAAPSTATRSTLGPALSLATQHSLATWATNSACRVVVLTDIDDSETSTGSTGGTRLVTSLATSGLTDVLRQASPRVQPALFSLHFLIFSTFCFSLADSQQSEIVDVEESGWTEVQMHTAHMMQPNEFWRRFCRACYATLRCGGK